MSLVGRFHVKANYIRAAKDNWVPCEVRLLTDDIDTFLCIKSKPLGFYTNDEEVKSIFSEFSNTGTISSRILPNSISRPFTALCNLSEYKSCTVRAVSFNDAAYFAIKLVPAGIFGNKRLFLAIDNENEVTEWMGMIKHCLGKKHKRSPFPLKESTTPCGTLRKSESQDTIRIETNSKFEFEIDTIDNEVYEPYSPDDVIPAVVEQTGDWEKLRLTQLDCFLRLTEDRLELLDTTTQRLLHWFPYLLIRRFGCVGGVLRVDAGRRCSTGDGKFFFRCTSTRGQPVDALGAQIRQLALEAKHRLRTEQGLKKAASNQDSSRRSSPSCREGLSSRTSTACNAPANERTLTQRAALKAPFGNESHHSDMTSILPPRFVRQDYRKVQHVALDEAEAVIPPDSHVTETNSSTTPLSANARQTSPSEMQNSRSPASSCNLSSSVTKSSNGRTSTDTDDVFIASPWKNDQVSNVLNQSGMYDNIPSGEQRMHFQINRHKFEDIITPKLSSNVTTPRSEVVVGSTDKIRELPQSTNRIESSLMGPVDNKLSNQLNDPPAITLDSNIPSRANEHKHCSGNFKREVKGPVFGSYLGRISSQIPPPTAPKPTPLIQEQASTTHQHLKDSDKQNNAIESKSPDIKPAYASSRIHSSSSTRSSYNDSADKTGLSKSIGPRSTSMFNDSSHLDLKDLDDVLKELRMANENVTTAVHSAAKCRKIHGLINSRSEVQECGFQRARKRLDVGNQPSNSPIPSTHAP